MIGRKIVLFSGVIFKKGILHIDACYHIAIHHGEVQVGCELMYEIA